MTLDDIIRCIAPLTIDGLLICALPPTGASTFYDPWAGRRYPGEGTPVIHPPLIRWSNVTIQEIVGRTGSALDDRSLFELIPQQEAAALSAALDGEDGEPVEATCIELSLIHADGSLIQTHVTIGRPPFTADGQDLRVLTIKDVTGRQRDHGILQKALIELSRRATEAAEMRDQLKESQYRLSVAVNVAKIGLWDWDLRRERIVLSDEWFGMLGYRPTDFSNHMTAWLDLVHPDDLANATRRVSDCLVGRTRDYEAEFRMRCADGDFKWIYAAGEVVERDADGMPMRLVGTHMDQSKRRLHEARLGEAFQEAEQARERLAKLANNAPGVLYEFVLLPDGTASFPYMSDGISDLFGISREDMMANSQLIFTGVYSEDREEIETRLMQSATDLTPFSVEYRVHVPEGGFRWLNAASLPERQADGSTLWHGYLQDITERKTIEIALAQARDDAEAANKAKSQFLANMSHEIRTPMNGVLGMAAALADTPLDEGQRRLVDVIQEAGDALLNVLNDILDFSKIEANQLTLENVPFRISDLANKVESLHALKAREKNLHLDVVRDPDAPDMRLGDPHRILQVLHNLISNAIKFTEQGEITVRIYPSDKGVSGASEPADTVTFEVRDTGIGMTADQCERVFSEFVQADNSTTRRFGGTGLGLAIVRGLVDAMHGRLTLASTPGEGTVFRVDLPLAHDETASIENNAPAQDDTAIEPPCDPERESRSGARPPRILVAEDNAMNRMVLQALLAPTGADMTFVENGQDAVKQIESLPGDAAAAYDLILMDIQMPVMDGITAMKIIRERQNSGRTPTMCIIALTANALDTQVRSYREAGFDTHVAKPIRTQALFDAIEKAVSIRRTAQLLEQDAA
ncbi:MAG: PAS domain-containing protein [Alphaproteobacteria bacterium]